MSVRTQRARTWPATRMRIRAVVSATMVPGWVVAAASGLVPYLLIGRGREAASAGVLWLGRAEWMSLHVWMSVAMVAFTLAHVALNRRGVTKAVKIVAGVERRPAGRSGEGVPRRRRPAWAGVIAVLGLVTVLGIGFARGDSGSGEGAGGRGHAVRVVDAGGPAVEATSPAAGTPSG